MREQPRPLETLIEQFNRASEIDHFSQFIIGETYWAEVDGIRTRMVDIWIGELSPEERTTFEAHVAQRLDDTARALGYESALEMAKAAGQRIFRGIEFGIAI
jgi:hypothetical protein